MNHDVHLRGTACGPRWRLATAGLLAAVTVTNAWVLSGIRLPWIGPAAGFLFAVCLPAWMLSQKVNWWTDQVSERLGYSVVAAVLALVLIGLALNTVLPHLGVPHPLDRGPVLAGIDVWCVALWLWRRKRFRPVLPRPRLERLSGMDRMVGGMAALCVPAAIIGAVRLNNGAGGGVTLAMLVTAAGVFTLLLAKREQLNPGTITAAIYFISLAMLLMTSLRGWYTTGHDIQEEYRVFELTKSNGNWDISRFQNAYNACLSITILPTVLWQVTRVDDPYIYKFFFQVLFALCPVFVYRITRRRMSSALAITATIYFVAFPTYFGDMPFLNRQEIAFLFVAACILLATDTAMPLRACRIGIGLFSVGVVLSHYSTAYVFAGTVVLGWIGYRSWPFIVAIRQRSWRSSRPRPEYAGLSRPRLIGLGNVSLVLAAIVLWNGTATHTSYGIVTTLTQAVGSLRQGPSSGARSSDVSYSLFSPDTPSDPQVLTQYTTSTLAQTAPDRAAGLYYPEKTIRRYPVRVVTEPNLPTTDLGRLVDDTGLKVTVINSLLRAGTAKLLQLFVCVGLIAVIFLRRRRSGSIAELTALGGAALAMVAVQVILPDLSVNYGVLRAFLQALIVFAPFVAIGSSVLCRPAGKKWGLRISSAIAMLFFLSLTGVIPQILGGYPAQLHLNNSGQYYDIYYVHPQEVTAIQWLEDNTPTNAAGQIQSEVETDKYTFSRLQTFADLSPVNDVYPTLIRKNAFIFLGYTTVQKRQSTFSYEGDLITYQYPIGLLDSTKDLLYSSNGARIYR